MERSIRMEEVSDGRLYGLNDMVKAGCEDCIGCSACCQNMGASIILDPYDIYRLTTQLEQTFEGLRADKIELNVVDGMILPNLAMTGERQQCAFLDENGRCGIHPQRPGICRLFPLGRLYENGSFQYFLQVHECRKEKRTKVKVRKWIDTPDINRYEAFINSWHYFLKDMQGALKRARSEEKERAVNLYVLRLFYMQSYTSERDFYEQFEERLRAARQFAQTYGLLPPESQGGGKEEAGARGS